MLDAQFRFSLSQIPSRRSPAVRKMLREITVPVVSDPVPAVVGIAMSGESAFLIGRPFPNGAFTKSRNCASG